MSWLDRFLTPAVKVAGSLIGSRPNLNFVSGVTATDNPTTNAVDVTVAGAFTPPGNANKVLDGTGAAITALPTGLTVSGTALSTIRSGAALGATALQTIGGGTAPNYWYTTTSRATLVNQTSANDLFTLGSLASNALYSVEARVLIQRAATGGVCGYYKLWLATKTDGGVATDLSAAASERALNSGTSGMLTLATTAGVIKLQFNPNDGANTFYVLSIVTVEVNTNGA